MLTFDIKMDELDSNLSNENSSKRVIMQKQKEVFVIELTRPTNL